MNGSTVRRISSLAFVACVSVAGLAFSETGQARTRIEVDEANKQIRLVVDGVSIAQFVSTGLIVTGDISFDGHLTDRMTD